MLRETAGLFALLDKQENPFFELSPVVSTVSGSSGHAPVRILIKYAESKRGRPC